MVDVQVASVSRMLRATVDTSSMFCLQPSRNMTLSVGSSRQSHNTVDNVASRFPFAIQHLLGIDASRHQHHPHDVSPFTQQHQQQQQSPLSSDLATSSQPTTDDVTYNAWTSTSHVHSSDVTPTTWYRGTDAMVLDDVIGCANVRHQSSLPQTSASHRRLAATRLTCLPSPTSLLPALNDNVSGKRNSRTIYHAFVGAIPIKTYVYNHNVVYIHLYSP